MNRDGYAQSIWQRDMPDYRSINSWNEHELYDVLIAGAGITGLTTALLLQLEGKKCIIAEAHTVGFGTSGGTTAHLNSMLDSPYNTIAKDFGADAATLIASGSRLAIDMIEDFVTAFDIDCGFTYQSGYLFAQNDEETKELEEIMEATRKTGTTVSWSEQIPVPLPFTKACRFEFQAQFHAAKYLFGLAKAFEAAGGVILQHCKVSDVKKEKDFTVSTTLGNIHARHVVYATHIPPGINLLHLRCAPYRSYAAAFRLKGDVYPDGMAYDLKDPYHYFRTQVLDGKKYVIGGGFDHKTGHEENTANIFRELEAYLRQHFEVESIDFCWSSQYYNSTDGLPYIGLLPGYENRYVGTAYAGNGMTMGTLAGKIICDMICGVENPFVALLAPGRIKPVAGFSEFVKENADIVSQFIGRRFSYEKIKTLSEIAVGDAMVVDWEGGKMAIYKDDSGKIHAVDPVCPHAKCLVSWNNAERSWDCGCHGARYAPNGDLLTGPSTKGLTSILFETMDGD